MARENTWGYKRIHGELKKLGIKRVRTGQAEPTGSVGVVGMVQCEGFLGGLLKSYRRAA